MLGRVAGVVTEDTIRCWLVERELGQRNVVTLVYATPDGRRYQRRERSQTALRTGSSITAAVEVAPEDLEPVPDEETRDRYATEAERTAAQYEPGEPI